MRAARRLWHAASVGERQSLLARRPPQASLENGSGLAAEQPRYFTFLSLKTISAITSSSAYSRIAFEGPCGSASISTRRSRSLSSAACFSSSIPAQAEELT